MNFVLVNGIVAYTSSFLRPNVCDKINQFLPSIKKDAHKRKLVLFFCLTVYTSIIHQHLQQQRN